jgi:ABC-type glutathione transport system ATPase component
MQYTGEYIVNSLGIPPNWIWRPMLALLGFAISFYIGAAVILQYMKTEMRVSRARPTDLDESAGKEKMTARSSDEVRTVTIRLEGYALDIEKRSWWGKKIKDLAILKPVSAEFQPGVLNVIMGPSGSGKTSLLNSMARRLKDDFTTKYRTFGHLVFNGAVPSEQVVQSICSFVTQDDDALLPSLTVRETLR